MKKEQIVEALISNDESVWTETDRPFLMALNQEQLDGLADGLVSNKISEKEGADLDQEGDSDETADGKDAGDSGRSTSKTLGKGKKKMMASNGHSEDDSEDEEESMTYGKGKKKKMAANDGSEDDGSVTNTADYIANAPAEIREVLNEGLIAHNREKQQCISIITSNENNGFDKGELSAMSLNSLRKLAKLSAKPAKKVVANSAPMFSGQGIVENNGNGAGECLPLPSISWDAKK